MLQDEQTFLTMNEAVDAIAADFSQYGPQPRSFYEIAPLILGGDFKTDAASEGVRAFIRRDGDPSFAPVDDEMLGFYLIHALESIEIDVQTLARICAAVFQTTVWPGKIDGQAGVWVENQMDDFVCKRCGRCCCGLEHVCAPEDLILWEQHGREDILARISGYQAANRKTEYRIWIDPETGDAEKVCPFLAPVPGKTIFRCTIQTVKPLVCREYPFTRKHARLTGCPGFQVTGSDSRKHGKRVGMP